LSASTQIDFDKLDDESLLLLDWEMRWAERSRQKQRTPPGNWLVWGIQAGRGFGKTETGAQWLGRKAATEPNRYCVIAPTYDDVRRTCFEGESGLFAVIPHQLITARDLGLPMLRLWNGSEIRGFAADTYERLRGPQHAAGWCDEIASWRYPRAAWDMYQMGLRLGRHTQTLWTGTPKPTPFIRDLIKQTDVLVRGATMENRANLAPSFFKQLMKYEGTAIGRQEIYGELLDPEDSGFIKRNQWRLWSSRSALPTFEFIVMSLDTAFTEKTFDKKDQKTDPTACSVWGVFVHENQRHVMLLDCWEDSLGFPQLVERVKKERLNTYGSPETLIHDGRNPVYGRPLYGANKPRGKEIDVTLIEDKGSGISLRQQLASEDVLGVPYNPGRSDKLARLHAVSPMFAAHRVWCVESGTRAGEPRTWAEPLISQVCTYVGEGSVEHDDLLDTTTQALKYISDRFMGGYTLPPKTPQKKLEEDVERRRRQDRVVNFYG